MNNIVEDNQRGYKKGAKGCKDQLMLNRYIMEDANENQKNLRGVRMDYQKTYVSILHKWIIKVLRAHKVTEKFIDIIQKSMRK